MVSTLVKIAAVALTVSIACAAPPPLPAQPAAIPGRFGWCNPIDVNLRDPQIIVVDHDYVLTGTAPPFFEQLGPSPGVKLWSSDDLLHWRDVGVIVKPNPQAWDQLRFWAPEIFHNPADHKFYCTFNCPDGPHAKSTQSVGLAVAENVTGPYRVLTVDRPLCPGNDADLFRDDDGKVYLFRSGITAIEVDLLNAKTIGNSFSVLPGGPEGAWDGRSKGAPAVGMEGPSVMKIGDTYYLFYSSWGRGYEVGYATSKSVHGPWTRYANNPIYGAQDKTWAARYKHVYSDTSGSPYRQVGHNSIFRGPDGRWWICAHAYRVGDPTLGPHLVIDPLNFHGGVFEKTPVSFTPQSVPIKAGDYPPNERQ